MGRTLPEFLEGISPEYGKIGGIFTRVLWGIFYLSLVGVFYLSLVGVFFYLSVVGGILPEFSGGFT